MNRVIKLNVYLIRDVIPLILACVHEVFLGEVSSLGQLHCNVAPQILDPAQVWALGRPLHDSKFLCLEPCSNYSTGVGFCIVLLEYPAPVRPPFAPFPHQLSARRDKFFLQNLLIHLPSHAFRR